MSEDEDKMYEVNQEDLNKSSSSECEDGFYVNEVEEKKSRRRSTIWQLFDIYDKQNLIASCRLCGGHLSFKSTTGNLQSHIKRKHGVALSSELSSRSKVVVVEKTENEKMKRKMSEPVQEENDRHFSPMWRWFDRISKVKATCRVCGDNFSYASSTSNLRTHLKRRHPRHHDTLLKLSKTEVKKPEDVKVENRDDSEVAMEVLVDDTCVCGADQLEGEAIHKSDCPQGGTPCSWDYFDKIDLENAHCKLCQSAVPWGTNINDLRDHLIENHPEVELDDKEHQTIEPHEVLIANQSEDEVDIKKNRNYFEDSLANHKRRSSFFNSPKHKRRKVVINDLKSQENSYEQSLDKFGLFIASLMRMLPRETADRFQIQIIERLMKERSRIL